MTARLRMGELVAMLALGQDNAFGQPLESQFRSCLLADRLCDLLRVEARTRETVYWTALLRYLGCTGHAHEVAALFGDEIGLRARTLVHDVADPHEVVHDLVDYVASDPARRALVESVLQHGRPAIAPNFAAGCEIGDALAARLGMSDDVRAALRSTFERWNGQGFPDGVAGTDIPLAMRIVHLTHDAEALARHRSPAECVAIIADRRGRTYDPELVDAFVERALAWLDELITVDPLPAVLALEPHPRRLLRGDELDDALAVVADFVDMKSPFMAGHSRRTASLAAAAARDLSRPADSVVALRHAGFLHDLGTTAIPNSIWDKPAPLTTAELDRVRVHTMLTEQMLRHLGMPDVLRLAAAHHERPDGSGYHRNTAARDLDGQILAASDIYVGMTADRADRPALAASAAAAEVAREVDAGRLDSAAAGAVLRAAGHRSRDLARRTSHPGGLTAREVEVLSLAAHGLTVKEIADRLVISAKTADHHLQHIYTKIGVTSRGAAALWAMQHGLVD